MNNTNMKIQEPKKPINYKDRYKDYRKEVQEQMNNIIDNYEIEDGYLLTLDLLAINLDLMYESIDSIKEHGFEKKDFKDRTVKNHAVQQLNSSQQTIIKLLNNFPSNTLAKEKIKKLSEAGYDTDDSVLDEYI